MMEQCRKNSRCLILEAINTIQRSYQPGLPCLGGFGGETSPVTIGNAIKELLIAKLAANRRPVYVKNLRHYLSRFAHGHENSPLSEFSSDKIEEWLKKFPAPEYRQTWLNRISTLFSFAVRKDWLPKNPCDKIDRVSIDHKPPQILSPAQSQMLLDFAPDTLTPYVVLSMMAGIRPHEVVKLDWKQIDLKTRVVRVNEAKTRQRRIVPLEPRAVALLAPHVKPEGAVTPASITIRRFHRSMREKLGFEEWPKDVLRHTAASYLLAIHHDANKVAMILGNSPKILLTHYHDPVSDSDAAGFWNEWPTVLVP